MLFFHWNSESVRHSLTLLKSWEGQHLENYKMNCRQFTYLVSIIESGELGNSLGILWCSAVVLKDGLGLEDLKKSLGLEVKVLVLEKRSCWQHWFIMTYRP